MGSRLRLSSLPAVEVGWIFCILAFMGKILYYIAVRLYDLMIFLSSVINPKAQKIRSGRRQAFADLEVQRRDEDRILWFHCASLGEFEQGLPVMEDLKKVYPEYKLFVSFFSPSGYEVQKNNPLLDCVFYLPSDSRSNALKLLELLNPVAVFFVKYEFWYHYIRICAERQVPIISISTILRPGQVFFKIYGGFYRRILYSFSHFFVQNEETCSLLQNIGINRVTISGDTRFDRVNAILNSTEKIPYIESYKNEDTLVVLGSTWKPDIDLWADYINNNEDIKFIVAPHHINEDSILHIENIIHRKTIRYSRIQKMSDDVALLIVDNIGMLSRLYKYGEIAFVGGAFNEGIHNVLEPAIYGIPVIIGRSKTNRKYQEVVSLVRAGGAFEVTHPSDLEDRMSYLLDNEMNYRKACAASEAYVKKNLGATDIIMDHLRKIL